MKNLVLIGMMGVAKSTVGRIVADKLNLTFVDGDSEIESRNALKISEIFAIYGEERFRRMEKIVYEEFSNEQNMVIACGGGVVLSPEIMEKLSCEVVVRLTATPEMIYQRVKNNAERPLLKDGGVEKIRAIAEQRENLYLRYAHYTVDNTDISVNECAEKVIEYYLKNA